MASVQPPRFCLGLHKESPILNALGLENHAIKRITIEMSHDDVTLVTASFLATEDQQEAMDEIIKEFVLMERWISPGAGVSSRRVPSETGD
jgi:hypothetical protein